MYSVMSLLHAAVTARERQAIDRQKHDGADHRHDEPDRLSGLIDPERAADPAAEQGPDDAKHDDHDHAPRVRAWHQELRDDADDEAEYDPDEDIHGALPGPVPR